MPVDKLKNFGFLLYDLTRLYARRFEQHAREISLTLTQCRALVYLSRSEGICQARLAELASIEPMMMVRILDRMEAERLLERRPDPADRRARCLYLTSRAGPMLQIIDRLAAKTRAEVLAGLGKAERESLLHMIEHLHGNLTALGSEVTMAAAAVPKRRPARGRSRVAARSSPRTRR
jgi:MarR family transcriptional regulator, transcriptional regulator for hemolysin